jgi:hypothetical protein
MISRNRKTLKCLFSVICLVFSINTLTAQTPGFVPGPSSTPKPAPNPAVAYVYVSQTPVTSGPNQVVGFVAHENGALTSIEGSPFDADIDLMAVNGKYLFGGTTDQLYINSYTIGKNGALTFAVANDIYQITGGTDTYGVTGKLDLDHMGATLYDTRYFSGWNNSLYAFIINKATGALTLPPGFTMDLGNGMTGAGASTISADNKYLYQANSGWAGYDISVYERRSNGSLGYPPANISGFSIPADKTGYRFDPIGISADPSNHVAVSFASEEGNMGPENGPNQIGVYTVDAKGNISTTSTWKNMPKVAVGDVALRMSSSGKLLAAFGGGLEIFHFNGSAQVTPYTILMKNVAFTDVRWDKNNHLFALTRETGELYVFTATPTGVSMASGSPYSVPSAQAIIVRPLPLK